MLNARENFIETVEGGHPDRYVNNYEFMQLLFHPMYARTPKCAYGAPPRKNAWGITEVWPENTPGVFPVHTPELIVLKDIEDWKDYVHAPATDFSEAEWDIWRQTYRDFDRSKCMCAAFYNPGLFEQSHHLASITEMLMNYITNTDEAIELIKYLAEYELMIAEGICENLKPDIIFHHDDWGSETNSFLRPEMFAEIFLEPYKEIYSYYKEHGVKYVIHHSDSYAANLVPYMIEMGIDVWQGPMRTNNVPELVRKYGDQITFMGNIDNKLMDFVGWTREDCARAVRIATEEDGLGPEHYIPCITQGGPGSTCSGSYECLVEELDKYNAERFGFTVEEIQAQRTPLQIMFK